MKPQATRHGADHVKDEVEGRYFVWLLDQACALDRLRISEVAAEQQAEEDELIQPPGVRPGRNGVDLENGPPTLAGPGQLGELTTKDLRAADRWARPRPLRPTAWAAWGGQVPLPLEAPRDLLADLLVALGGLPRPEQRPGDSSVSSSPGTASR